ncbi:hypothetical protein BATDEDRAFT_24151 [Batrachochytrium dendrobatidis JAM81]|uniref:IMS import disulfide relay-system CHCH-CHCH-like Cx9C domain-containing protein n=1 Tax=Batrachochytrium dendrobatidis (strain JAM81 / FGSC 10211) TaxID=684364 RepID=F4P0J3_BATDJ|nr:uncharacterized protein BATDEDRAFT_24151 [Batrachochytrium dendrobatidis JAM81]EGF81294.1 hypothetical protein BATDEDRAFT_24151 [Batrachochytrium dendrobatidis JAM81]KAJ8329695.1 hypothetical protein O5D80_002257 [Batrachochytrium dendrobatidis]KAK5669590.1 hypothetical protein QVD99_003981 [Batrachochytrium dendrobatidis]|eukprot:XP_006677923.1 hypothetical protein BATDEDRAFT_24151 [Batrachochytrium dendrobatidis JAM81]
MEDTLDIVSKHCGLQVKLFGACLERNGGNWESNCLKEKNQLTKCAEENVGNLKRIKQECSGAIAEYRQCLTENVEDPKACVNQLRSLYQCHQDVANSALS